VPGLALWAGLPMRSAVGTSLLVIVLNTLAGFSGYAGHVDVDFALVAAVAAAAIAGSFLGSSLARRTDPNALRRAFALCVAAMAALVVVRETDVWLASARAALPGSAPQLLFALLVLDVGIAAGRLSSRAGADPLGERSFSEGAGI